MASLFPHPTLGVGHRMPCRGVHVQRITPAVALAISLLAAACSSSENTGPGPTPTAVRAQTGNQQTGVAGATLATQLSVLVTDKDNKPVGSRRVDWDVGPGSGTVSPASTTTDSRGIATTTWTLGTTAGTARVTAQVNGVNPATFTATVLPGAPAALVANPDAAFLGVGDTLRIRAALRDQFGNEISGQAVGFTSLDGAVASVSTTGLVTALTQGAARIVADASGRADTVPITVGPAGSGVCGPITPRTLAVGDVFTPGASTSNVAACLAAPSGVTAEYALTLISTATSFGTATVADVLGIGSAAPVSVAVTASRLGGEGALPDAFPPALGTVGAALPGHEAPHRAEVARRELERRELPALVESARTWQAERAQLPSLLAEAKVGDVLRLNVNANSACTQADTRNGRVAAVGTRAIIVTDTDNPTGGYTDAEYTGILATFDTLVYPMDTTAFGAPSNISQYGKIILFYTRAVNALTPQGANFTIGGFFFARDLYPKTARNNLAACAGSNENEMFYLLVPDPNGTVNSNRRTKDEVTLLNLTTIAHELQHLINASRRLYVNVGAAPNEQTWLDEGLSHVAEELLYLRISNFTTRQNLTLSEIGSSTTRSDQFRNYASQNFSRFYSFLIAPEVNSPYAPNDSLATRGAIWNFLRFAAGRQGASSESAFLRALVNSTTTGVNNLQGVLSGGQFADYLRDWTIALIADDHAPATTTALGASYTNPTWNFRNIYPGLRFSGGAALGVYPIATRSLVSNVPQRITLAGGTSSYLRFSVAGGQRALVTLSSNGAVPAVTLRYGIVRLR
ncbi:MAG: Ig domain-containing protein [Gemmatimonas sp.]|jgi:hypothetical protein|uniref:Ig-like domain-containing protein n=1 Tax=Gemmatimonas sp. TaxID=1962908 RepID=UPI00391F44C3|nr:Ig-like domain-containing protein [Gemmatimonadota bacterium]